ncbi:hypothetical protein [Sphingomonas sp.]|uniref:hypothetical protein n=1 Tax=Sphingomonas sp. TaxID=28214 RepID=UPI002DD6407D|nr:hypothetical protein [Sphingomonas sp.]
MRSHVEFRSPSLLDARADDDAPRGKSVAALLAERLPARGYQIIRVEPEDWGWRIDLANAAFPLWIGCGHYAEYPDCHLCFIEPSQPHIRRWLKRVATSDVVEPLATAIEAVLLDDAQVSDLRWWTDAEIELGTR